MNGIQLSINSVTETPPNQLSDEALQASLLDGVSRTFALTIPQLPRDLHTVVANAYLLCRIVDTIEDEVALNPKQKKTFCSDFINVVNGSANPTDFSLRLSPLLSAQTIQAEHELIRDIPRVVAITHQFSKTQRDALNCCVETMAGGMPEFQAQNLENGLQSMRDMSCYCYFVAGCVGEMLTKLFCDHSKEIASHRESLMELSGSFGQGLQMTNILKDIWDDHNRGVCWLPQEMFTDYGFQLKDLQPNHQNENFRMGLENLISVAYGHLQNAMTYTLLIPKSEIGIRDFCLWAIGMALLTLRKIQKYPYFSESGQVKISRRSVKTTIVISRLSRVSDKLLLFLFQRAGASLNRPNWQAEIFKFN